MAALLDFDMLCTEMGVLWMKIGVIVNQSFLKSADRDTVHVHVRHDHLDRCANNATGLCWVHVQVAICASTEIQLVVK
jgi:hypothetical protein